MRDSLLRQYSRQLVRLLGMLEKECGVVQLTPVQAHALGEIKLLPMTVNQLSEQLVVDKSNASRTVSSLQKLGFVSIEADPADKRRQVVAITASGCDVLEQLDQQQNRFFSQVIEHLTESEQLLVKQGMESYLKGLVKTCQPENYIIRPLTREDNASIATVIRQVSAEYGLTPDKGYGVSDLTLDDMYNVYNQPGAGYWVIEHHGDVVGGGGFAPLKGNVQICELQKMYFLPPARGKGLAKRIANMVELQAKAFGYQSCYLESTACLHEAVALYEKLGFRKIDEPLGNTGHDACEIVMLKTLQ